MAMAAIKVLSAVNLSGNICHYSAINWSEDNRICLTTDKGIHILIPQCKPNEFPGILTFQRQFIKAPSQVKQFQVEISREDFHDNIDRETMFALMLDRTISPLIASQQSYKSYRIGSWSPRIPFLRNRCVLAALTMDHRLQLYKPAAGTMEKMCELSDLFHDYVRARNYNDCSCTSDANELDTSQLKHFQMKQRVYTLAAITMIWTHVFSRNSDKTATSDPDLAMASKPGFVLLLVAMKSAHVVVWKMSHSKQNDFSAEVVCLFHTDVQLIESLQWLEIDNETGLLAVGSHSGQIKVFRIKIKWEDKNTISINLEWTSLLWKDEDRLAVTQMGLIKKSLTSYCLLASKGSYFVGFEFVMNDGAITVITQSVQVGCHIGHVTGILQYHDSFLVSSADGCLQMVQIDNKSSGLSLVSQKLTLDLMNNKHSLMGITKSPSGVLLCTVGRLTSYFDHLSIKEPIAILIFSLENMSQTLSLLMQNSRHLNDLQDVVTYVQMLVVRGESIPEQLKKLIWLPFEELSFQTCFWLQIIRWLWRTITIFGANTYLPKADEILKVIDQILMKRRLLKNIRLLDKGSAEKMPQEFKQYLNFASKVLEIFFDLDDGQRQLVKDTLSCEKFFIDKSYEEKCPICDEDIPYDDIKLAKCPNLHIFGRCCLTAKATILPSYMKCSRCEAVALKIDWLTDERCTFCDGDLS